MKRKSKLNYYKILSPQFFLVLFSISLSKIILKCESLLTTIALISTSITFMISPTTQTSNTNLENNYQQINENPILNTNTEIINEAQEFVFENINNEFLSNNSSTTVQPIVPTLVKPDNAGSVIRKTYTAGTTTNFVSLNNGFINNVTEISNEEVIKTISQSPNISIIGDTTPEVLVMHTHATETYLDAGQTEWFDLEYTARTTDENKNVIRVGEEITKQLENAGIGVIHDKTLHDYPSFNGAYERSATTIKEILNEYPTIKVVLDVHRDAIVNDTSTITSPVTTINGKDAAQIMIISGCDNGMFNMPNYMENLKFSSALQNQLELMYPSLTRPILFDYRKYNQDLTTGSILLEMGGHANTLEEAIYSGELLGNALAQLLLSLKS